MCNSNTWVTTCNKECLNSDCTLQHTFIWQDEKHSYISKDQHVGQQSCNILCAFNSQQNSGKWMQVQTFIHLTSFFFFLKDMNPFFFLLFPKGISVISSSSILPSILYIVWRALAWNLRPYFAPDFQYDLEEVRSFFNFFFCKKLKPFEFQTLFSLLYLQYWFLAHKVEMKRFFHLTDHNKK